MPPPKSLDGEQHKVAPKKKKTSTTKPKSATSPKPVDSQPKVVKKKAVVKAPVKVIKPPVRPDARAVADMYRKQALAAARRRSEFLRRAAIRQREVARAVELDRQARLRRAAENRMLVQASRGNELAREAVARPTLESSVRQLDQQQAAARTRAYDVLQRRSSAALRLPGRGAALIDDPSRVARVTPGEYQRNVLVGRAQKTGDWSPAIAELLRQSRSTNGSHIDVRLMEKVQEEVVVPAQQLRDSFTELVADLAEAEASGDEEALLRLVEDPDNIELYELFIKTFGDGVKPGTFTATQEQLEEISMARSRASTLQFRTPQEARAYAAGQRREQALVDRALRESTVRSSDLAPGRGQQPIDDRFEALEFTQQVFDPDTGQMRSIKRVGLDAWVAREGVRERERVMAAERASAYQRQTIGRLLAGEGYRLEGVGSGRVTMVDEALERQHNQVREWMPQWKLNKDGIPNRIAAAAGNPGLQEQLIREFMHDAELAYDANHTDLRRQLSDIANRSLDEALAGAPAGSRFSRQGGETGAGAYQKAKTAWLSGLAYHLGKAEGWDSFAQFSATGLGGAVQGLFTVGSAVLAGARLLRARDGDSSLLEWNTGIFGGESHWGEIEGPDAQEAAATLGAGWGGGTDFWSSLGGWASAIRDYGPAVLQGDVGGLAGGLLDPLNVIGPGMFIKPGMLAIARAGGMAGLRAGGSSAVRTLVSEYARYAAPRVLGGAGRDVVRTELAKISLAKKLGLAGSDALRLGDDEFRDMIERLAANRTDEVLASDAFARLTQASGIDKNQLLNMVQQELPDILRRHKIFTENPFEAAARMRAVRASAQRARSEAEAAAQLIKAETDRAESIRALAAVTGRPLKPDQLTPAQLVQHEALVRSYSDAAQEYLRVAEAGVRAADEIEKGGATLGNLRGLQAQLKRSAKAAAEFEDAYRLDIHGRKQLASRGVVGRHFDRLARFRGGGDPTAPSFVDQSLQQVAYDQKRVNGLMTQTLRQLRAIPVGERLPSGLKDRLRQLKLAKRGLEYEKAMLDNGRTLARSYLKRPRNMARVRDSIAPQRVAPLVGNPEQLAVETGRDFMRQLDGAKVRPLTTLSSEQQAALGALRTAMADEVDLVDLIGAQHALTARRALGGRPSLLQTWVALRMAYRDPLWAAEFGGALQRLETNLIITARRAGFDFSGMKSREAADFLWDVLREDHIRLGAAPVDLSGYRQLDSVVQPALVNWRRHKAVGQIRLRERRFKKPSGPSDAVFHDTDPFEVFLKQRVLAEQGSTIFAYDDLRGVMQRPMLRQQTAARVLKRALERSVRDGIDLDAALKIERDLVVDEERVRNVEEFFARPDQQGMPPETRLRAFEEKMMRDDLPESEGVTLSAYQEASLRQAFEAETGFSYFDDHQVARYYRGELDVMPSGARAPRHGEYIDFDLSESNVRPYVVPANHPKLVEAIPFGRGRGEVDDELQSLFQETQRMAHNWDLGADDFKVQELSPEARALMKGIDDELDIGDIDVDLETPRRPPGETELGEGAAERRGAIAGRRQNAAAEARRSSRRNFEPNQTREAPAPVTRGNKTIGWHPNAAPDGWQNQRNWVDARAGQFSGDAQDLGEALTGQVRLSGVQGYRQWLWDRMVADPAFRRAVRDLRGKNIVHRDGAWAQVLGDAADWMWTDDAAKRFDELQPHAARPATTATSGTHRELYEELAKFEEAHKVARSLAGYEYRPTRGKWVRAVEGMHAIDEEGFVVRLESPSVQVQQLDAGGTRLQPKSGRWVAVRDRDFPKEGLPRLVDLQGRPYGVGGKVSGTRVFETTEGGWVKVADATDPSGSRAAQMRRLSRRVEELKRQIKQLEQRPPARYRGKVGLSVHGDGIYIAEGTSNVTVAHELFHQFWDNEFNEHWVKQIEETIDMLGPELRSSLWQNIRIGRAVYDPAEFAAELYALWRVGDSAGSDVFFSWRTLRDQLGPEDRVLFDQLGATFDSHAPRVVDGIAGKLKYPPLNNRALLFKWLEDNGHVSRRTAEAIRAGERVWSVAEERQFFRGFLRWEPPWTDETVLRAVLNDPRLHEIMLREWGFFDGDEYEALTSSLALEPEQLADSLVWGKNGLKRQRTAEELRSWSIQRYGKLVSDDGKNLTRMPWLMRADNEYLRWTRRYIDDQGEALVAARSKLPEGAQKHLFDGDELSRVGIEIDPRLVRSQELRKLRAAITRATERRIKRLIKDRDVEPGEWLAQEQLRFAYDVTDQLLVDPVWRGILRGKPLGGAVLHAWGQFWRGLVSWQPAFPLMNLIESYGFKRLYLTIFEGGFRPLSIDAEGRRLVQSLRQIGAESDSIFHLSAGEPMLRVGNKYLSFNERGGALVRSAVELPVRISKFGEDALRLDFARRIAGDTYRAAVKTGMSVENAEWLARMEAKRMVDSFFAISSGKSWESALNELVPFFSYNFKNKTLAVRMIWNHPSVWLWGERLRAQIESANRDMWEKDHPGVPFPGGPSASWLWWKVGDEYYKIDLSSFSDWTRAMGNVMSNHTPLEWFSEFIRVPHPSQLGALAMFTGDDTPWGNPGSIRELSFWADLFYWTRGIDYSDPSKKRDFIQIMSQMLFFKKFGKIGAMDIKQSTFFALRQADPSQARAYLEANPDLQLYWDSLPPRHRIKGFDPMSTIHYRQLMTREENAEYDAALDELSALNTYWDRSVARYSFDPKSPQYKEAKRNAFIARMVFMNEHPILTRAWGMFMSPAEFAKVNEKFRVDDLADAWFNWKRPQRDAYDSDLAYQRALVDFNERREAFLEANPALQERLLEGRNAVETAWRQQELHWTEVLNFQSRLKIRILEEELRGAKADRDLMDLYYRVRDIAGMDLDTARYAMFDGSGQDGGLKRFLAVLPGFYSTRYARATPEQRVQMDRDTWYARGIKAVVQGSNSGKEFYELLAKDPKLMAEYFARNPDKKARFDANNEYIRWIGSWARKLEADDFDGAQGVWDIMPAWVKERYFQAHPDSGMRDGAGGGGSSTAVQYKGKWFKSPASRDRYIKFIEGGGSDADFAEGFAEGQRFSSPEARQRFLDGQSYYASLGRWVKMLQANDFVAADRYFRSLPDWMKEKYYAKHPDQRAKNDLDMEALHRGAEYFLAEGDDKLKILQRYPQLRAWLAEHGGDEGAMRGLVMAMYRAIPSSEPWLKRVFRERFPEIFSVEAAAERKFKKVATNLAAHPEMVPFYEAALKLQSALFMDQLKHSKVAPKPLTMQRKKRLVKRGKRRAARLHSSWTLHRDIRKYRSAV